MVRSVSGIVFSFLLCSNPASAEFNADKLGEAAGEYINATDFLEKIGKSKCAYVLKKRYSLNDALDEVAAAFPINERAAVYKFFHSGDFKSALTQNDRIISISLSAGKRDGLDEKTICGMLLANAGNNYAQVKSSWDISVFKYSK